MIDFSELLRAKDLEERYGIPAGTWKQWRNRGNGPSYMKLGGAVYYRLEDVEAWLKSRLIYVDRFNNKLEGIRDGA